MEIKLGDFGLACCLQDNEERKATLWGTPNYIAPEVLLNGKKGYSYEVDIWAIGVILYAMLFGRPPFETKDVKTTYWRIQNTAYEYPEDIHTSVEARHLIDSILNLDPKARPTLKMIKEHPFITKGRFIPRTLPVECYSDVIPPDRLRELETEHHENNKDWLNKYYFEERNSQDYSEPEGESNPSDNDQSTERILDLDHLHKLPLTHRVQMEDHKNLLESLENFPKENELKINGKHFSGSKGSNYKSPEKDKLMTFRKENRKGLLIQTEQKLKRGQSKDVNRNLFDLKRKTCKNCFDFRSPEKLKWLTLHR
jgi:serine/threonine protein kinase